jgi:hypothetical protein
MWKGGGGQDSIAHAIPAIKSDSISCRDLWLTTDYQSTTDTHANDFCGIQIMNILVHALSYPSTPYNGHIFWPQMMLTNTY